MKNLLIIFSIFLAVEAHAESVFLPNLGKNASGTIVGPSYSMDVNVTQGIVTTTDSANAVNASAGLPATIKIIGGYDGANVRVFSTDNTGKLNLNNISGAITLPTGAATAAKQPSLGIAGTASTDVLSVQGIAAMTPLLVNGSGVTQPVSQVGSPWGFNEAQINGVTPLMGNGVTGTGSQRVTIASDNTAFSVNAIESGTWNITNVSGTVSLPTGASTAAKQPALGTAGSASADVISVQGIASMTALKVDGSAVTQPVSLAGTQSVNVAQVNGVTTLMGNGTTGTGSQRVTIASDNTAFSVNTLSKTPVAVTVKQAAVTIGTSAVRLTNDGAAPASTRVLLVAQLLSTSTANCFLGSSSVANSGASRGIQMFAGQTFSFASDAGDYYAICDASSQTFYITEQE